MDNKAKRTLYICYFGLREPLVQTQVLPYLRELVAGGIDVSLVTFEPNFTQEWTEHDIAEERRLLAEDGIAWDPLAYHKRLSALATAYDVLAGARYVSKMLGRPDLDVIHCRIHVAMLIGALARKFSRRKPKLIFDIRGFFPEEYTDAGVWPTGGRLYRSVKRVERWLMAEADGFVVLTEKARTLLFGAGTSETRPVEVIPCCVDFETRFAGATDERAAAIRAELSLAGRFVLTHVGALGGLYLTREIVDLMRVSRSADPSTFALFLTQSDPQPVTAMLTAAGFADSDFLVTRVAPAEIPAYMQVADAGISFVQATYATQSRSPTKIPEYLAAGVPLIANSGVGDVDELIKTEGVGVLIDSFSADAYRTALSELSALGDISERCRDAARRRFDLRKVGGPRYRRLYERLLNGID